MSNSPSKGLCSIDPPHPLILTLEQSRLLFQHLIKQTVLNSIANTTAQGLNITYCVISHCGVREHGSEGKLIVGEGHDGRGWVISSVHIDG